MIIHVVKPGENIYSISRQYGVMPNKIIADNELTNPDRLVIGQTLVILGGTIRHVVIPGESIYSIAQNYGVSVDIILRANPQITNPMLIYPGQIILVPNVTQKLGNIDVNGYAFPNINMEVLRKTLLYLTYLSIFSYEVREDGSLNSINDKSLIEIVREAGVAPVMVITNLESGGGFSSDLARTILTDEEVQANLINNIITTLEEKNYYGVDVDFEYIYPENREDYNNFLRKLNVRLDPLGYALITSLAPKISGDQQGLLYEAHDYPVHGEIADHVILMTYEWGYTFGPPMAVAPINEVEKVLKYAVTAIPRDKILMGIPNYGYNWVLPYQAGTRASTISNTGAVDLVAAVGTIIQYDETSQSPFYYYYDEMGRRHVVWFEDARSIDAKLKLANEYDLEGVSYWTIGRYFPQNWLVLNSLFNVNKVL